MGLYIMFIYSGNSIGPLLGGFVVQGEMPPSVLSIGNPI